LIKSAVFAESLQQRKDFWHTRESISDGEKAEGLGIHFDISVPLSSIASFLEKTDAKIKENIKEAKIISFAHIGDGNIHYNLCLPKEMDKNLYKNNKEKAKNIVYQMVKQLNGSISAEHGIGVEKKEDLYKYTDIENISIMQKIKASLDPKNLMNPDKIFQD